MVGAMRQQESFLGDTIGKTKKLYPYIAKKCKKIEKNNLMVWRYENVLYICVFKLFAARHAVFYWSTYSVVGLLRFFFVSL